MIRRIVKMTFEPAACAQFQEVFEQSKAKIRAFPGCRFLELWRCKSPDNIFMTYSHWDSEEALEAYRHSTLFKTTWAKTKPLFSDRPEAWSLDLESSTKQAQDDDITG
ncbi:MAG TPA: antibiotic biosynthesis monooxygenase family protein [Saprospiraceae bacterium]|nr:antibiotic biosynthesis monooxygenase family protein [Saprospiraceae bacterium]